MTNHGKEQARPVAPSKSKAQGCCGGMASQGAMPSDESETEGHACVDAKAKPTAETGAHKQSHSGCCGANK